MLEIVLSNTASAAALGEIPHRFLPQGPRFSPDGNQVTFFGNGRIYVHSIVESETRAVVDLPDRHAGFSTWSPDGLALAFSAYGVPWDPRTKPPKIFRVDLADNRIEQLTSDEPNAAERFPHWSPSGQMLAFERGYYEATGVRTVLVITDRSGSNTKHLPTENGWRQAIGRLCWSQDRAHVLARESWQGERRRLTVFRIDDLEPVWSFEDARIRSGCFDPSGPRVLCVTYDSLRLFEFPSGEVSAELSLSELSPALSAIPPPTVAFDAQGDSVLFLDGRARLCRWRVGHSSELVMEDEPEEEITDRFQKEEYRFSARDGREIPVQRHLPSNPNGRAVVYVQSGPGYSLDARDPVAQRLLEEGYEVVRPAYRGTDGYGDEHRRANRGEWGRADVWDIVDCGVDWKKRYDAEDRPLVVAGFSYGGYLTLLALTYPEAPWSCGITLWGVTVALSRMRTEGLPENPQERERAIRERSPVAQAGKTRFPLLILHGGRDTTATVEDVQSIRASVRGAGLPCELAVFEEDTHGLMLSRPQMFRHMLDFLAHHSP